MWVRLSFKVPTLPSNYCSWWKRILGSVREYRQEFRTPRLIAAEAVRHIDQMKIEERFNVNLVHLFPAERRSARSFLPEISQVPEVDDWRSFLYRERGLSLFSYNQSSLEGKEGIYPIPMRSLVQRVFGFRPHGSIRLDMPWGVLRESIRE